MGCVLALAVTLLGSAGPATIASARRSCATYGRTIVQDQRVRLFVLSRSELRKYDKSAARNEEIPPAPIGVCPWPSGRPRVLYWAEVEYVPRGVPTAGRFAAWVSQSQGGTGAQQYVTYLLSVAAITPSREKLIAQVDLGPYYDPNTGYALAYDLGFAVDAVVSHDARFGWIGCTRTEGQPLYQDFARRKHDGVYPIRGNPRGPVCRPDATPAVYVPNRSARFGYQQIDRGAGINPTSLRLHGNAMTWLHDGQRRSFQLSP